MLLDAIDRGIGFYSKRKSIAKLEIFNPLHWIAFFSRIPIIILKIAGIETSNKIISNLYSFTMQGIMAIILALLATKLGISIPWDKILP